VGGDQGGVRGWGGTDGDPVLGARGRLGRPSALGV